MPSTFSPLLRIELQATGENDTTWGDKTNNNFKDVVESAIAGLTVVSIADADKTLTVNSGAADEARSAILVLQGTLTAQRSVVVPASSKWYIVKNNCNFPVTIKTASGTGASIVNGTAGIVYCDGTNVASAMSPTSDASITPVKLDTSLSLAWRFGAAVGIGRAQTYAADYGVLGIDGTVGARTTYYVAGVAKGELNATATTFDIAAAPGVPLSLTTNNVARLTCANDGAITIPGVVTVGGLFVGGALSVSGGATFGGVVSSSGGFTGITASNVRTALGYTPVQQGVGPGQNAAKTLSIGHQDLSGAQSIRISVDGVDYGEMLVSRSASSARGFIPAFGGLDEYSVEHFTLREAKYVGASTGSDSIAPRLRFLWSGRVAGSVLLQANGAFRFTNTTTGPGSTSSIVAQDGFFNGIVQQGLSDMRLKDRVRDLRGARSKLRELDCFYYTENSLARSLGQHNSRMQLGLSAQQVRTHFPELTALAPCDMAPCGDGWKSKTGEDYLTIDYARMTAVLVQALKEQDEQIEQLQSTLDAVLQRLSALERA